MSQKYLIKLKPLEPYFFGGEYTFGNKESQSYSAKSTQFPQQTSVLGMLRKTMLIQNGNMTMHKKGEWVDSKGGRNGNDKNYFDAIELAGKGGFSYEKTNDLGVIEELSPIFISIQDNDYVLNAKDSEYEPKLLTSKMMISKKAQESLLLKGYSSKVYKQDSFISTDKTSKSADDIFEEVQNVGIKKSKDGQSEEDAYFQKTSYMLKDSASFCFFASFEKELNFTTALVSLGADQSSFMLEALPTEETFDSKFHKVFEPKELSRAVLTSETLITQETYDACIFVLGKRSTYRQLENQKGKKSKRHYLLERGSVLYTNDLEKLSATLSQPHLQQAGINHFIAVKGA